jgi:hypothetical protein
MLTFCLGVKYVKKLAQKSLYFKRKIVFPILTNKMQVTFFDKLVYFMPKDCTNSLLQKVLQCKLFKNCVVLTNYWKKRKVEEKRNIGKKCKFGKKLCFI